LAISERFLEELKARLDIESVVAPYVALRKRGRTFVGLCPFHSEKTPSFTVYPDNQSFYCFGCTAGGEIITFTMRIENLDFAEAVRSLAQKAGLSMPEDGFDDSLSKRRKEILEANRAVLERCGRELLARETLDENDILQLTQGLILDRNEK